jgi:hypothetical protein
MPVGMIERPVDAVLRVLPGRTVGEIGELRAQLRGELADAIAVAWPWFVNSAKAFPGVAERVCREG